MRKQKLLRIVRKSYMLAAKVCGFESAEAESLKKRLVGVLSEGVLLKDPVHTFYTPEKARFHQRLASLHQTFLPEGSCLEGYSTVEPGAR